MSETKFCKDCRWCVPSDHDTLSLEYAKCAHLKATDKDDQYKFLVDAKPRPDKHFYCSTMRRESMPCGTRAKLFEVAIQREPALDTTPF